MKKGAVCFLSVLAAGLLVSFACSESFRVMGFIRVENGVTVYDVPKGALIVMSIIRYACYFAIVLLCAGFKFKKAAVREMLTEFHLKTRVKPAAVAITGVLSLISLCAFICVQTAAADLIEIFGWESGTVGDMVPANFGEYIGFLFAVAVLPAVAEELIFRGHLLNGLRSYGKWTAVLISALLFSLYHQNAAMTVYQFALGVFLALIAVESGSLLLSMLMHFLNNAIVLTYSYLAGSDLIEITWEIKTVISGIILAVLGIVVIMRLIKLLRRAGAGAGASAGSGTGVSADSGSGVSAGAGTGSGADSGETARKRFAVSGALGYIICIGAAAFLWITAFVSQISG